MLSVNWLLGQPVYSCRLRNYFISMGRSSFWTVSSTGPEIPCTLWNPKVYYRVHSNPPLIPILSEINPVHTTHSISWRPVLILSSHLRLGLPADLVPSPFPIKPLYSNVLLYTCLMSRPSHSTWFQHPYYILWGVQIMKLLIMHSSPPFSCYLVPLRLSILFSNTFSLYSCLSMGNASFTAAVKHQAKIIILCILIFVFLDYRLEGRRFWRE
jgi:hypothetical protein